MKRLRSLGVRAALLAALAVAAGADEIAIVPQPAKLVQSPGQFRLTRDTLIVPTGAERDSTAAAEQWAAFLTARSGFPLRVGSASTSAPTRIELRIESSAGDDPEQYELHITPQRLSLKAASGAGAFRGLQTVRQLFAAEFESAGAAQARDEWTLPCVRIEDRPRFRWRGSLLDCGRHFMTKEFIQRYIDLLAYHKLNVFHWHLTEDQGWRIEIKKYPRLAQISAWRKATRESEQPRDEQGRYGGFYSQDDIRDIVAYAAARHILVVPEIELPGHSLAALAAYPELSCSGGPFEVGTKWGVYDDVYCAGSERTFEFLEDVLAEVVPLFPGAYVHIGGDECPKTRWKSCAKCQARIKSEGLKDEHELQSYFIRRVEKLLAARNKRLIGWDEILEGGLAPNATVQSWRGMDGAIAAANAGHDVICSPTSHCYLDYAQSKAPGEPTNMGFLPLETVYAFEPLPAQLSAERARHVLGLEGNMWTEHAAPARIDWQVFPRLCALAEVAWSPRQARDFKEFERRMQQHNRRLAALGVNYFR